MMLIIQITLWVLIVLVLPPCLASVLSGPNRPRGPRKARRRIRNQRKVVIDDHLSSMCKHIFHRLGAETSGPWDTTYPASHYQPLSVGKNTPARAERRSRLYRKFERRARNTGQAFTYNKSPTPGTSPPMFNEAQYVGLIAEQSGINYIRDAILGIRFSVSFNKCFLRLANESSLSIMPDDPEDLLDGHISDGCYCWWILGEEFFRLVNIYYYPYYSSFSDLLLIMYNYSYVLALTPFTDDS